MQFRWCLHGFGDCNRENVAVWHSARSGDGKRVREWENFSRREFAWDFDCLRKCNRQNLSRCKCFRGVYRLLSDNGENLPRRKRHGRVYHISFYFRNNIPLREFSRLCDFVSYDCRQHLVERKLFRGLDGWRYDSRVDLFVWRFCGKLHCHCHRLWGDETLGLIPRRSYLLGGVGWSGVRDGKFVGGLNLRRRDCWCHFFGW